MRTHIILKVVTIAFFASCMLFFSGIPVSAQTYFYFQDSPDPDLYDFSWMELTAPSELERKGPDLRRFPVESVTPAQQGLNSLRLKWRSKSAGNWFAIAAALNWTDKNLTDTDTLSFYLYSVEGIAAGNLPKIFFEDTQNQKSVMISLSQYVTTLLSGIWTRVKVPMDPFLNQPNPIDYTKIKTMGFTQDTADDIQHTLYVDDVRVYKGNGTSPPVTQPQGLTAKGYDSHVFLKWIPNPEPYLSGYEIFQSSNGGQTFNKIAVVGKYDTLYTAFVRPLGTNLSLKYKITALNEANEPSGFSGIVDATTHDMTDDELLDMVQEATFRYFWEFGHPVSGLARERNTSGDVVTSGGSGFGIMAILVGIERGFITRDQGIDRILKILNFLETAERFHGAWPHWMNGVTGAVVPFSTYDNGGDLVETSFLAQGMLAARQYFDQPTMDEQLIVQKITTLWEGIEWDWYRRNNGNYLYWHWSPNYGWQMNMTVAGPNECMITYLLAIASPTHGIPATLYENGWAASPYYDNGKEFYGYKIWVGWDYGGPLFFTHYSFLGFDPRNIRDQYANYFNNNRNISLINRAYCIDNPKGYEGYGENCWGLTASDDPFGYMAHEPISSRDNGTITPTAALSAMPYVPEESLAALKHFYRNLGNKVWGNYGFYDAFNEHENWYADSYLAIDQGPIICMIENYRSSLLWEKFMANPDIQPMLSVIGFVNDPYNINDPETSGKNHLSFTNPSSSPVMVNIDIEQSDVFSLYIYDSRGIRIKSIFENTKLDTGMHRFSIIFDNFPAGLYFFRLDSGNGIETKKIIFNSQRR